MTARRGFATLAPLKTLPDTKNRHNVLRDRWEIPSVDQVMVEERAAAFTKRSIKTSAKLSGLKLAVSMMDLTTLEGKDTPGKSGVPLPQSDAAGRSALRRALLRGGLRLSESRPRREAFPRHFRRESRVGRDRVSRPA